MEQEPNYIKGFNDGFKMAKYSPELFSKLQSSLKSNNNYERGILEGAKEAEKEKENTKVNDLKQIRQNKEITKDKDR